MENHAYAMVHTNDNKTSFQLLIHESFVRPTTGVSFHAYKN